MKVYILKKSITDLKKPIIKNKYETSAHTVEEFIKEMVIKNYNYKIKESLQDCIDLAIQEFECSSYYIVNSTKDINYRSINDSLEFNENDEIILIKLKYVRGIIW